MTHTDTPEPPTNVVAALARVTAEIGGIPKLTGREHAERTGRDMTERGGVPYAYRGIDQIAAHAQPLFGRYGIVIVPTIDNHVIDEIEVGGKPWTDTTATVSWKIYGPGGVTDMIEARTTGLGRDNSDKGMNKAMTGAYKNLLLRILSIGDPGDDIDHQRHERDARPAYLTGEQAQQIVDVVVALNEPDKTTAKEQIRERWGSTKTIPADEWDTTVAEFLNGWVEVVAQQAADVADGGSPAERARQQVADDLEHITEHQQTILEGADQ